MILDSSMSFVCVLSHCHTPSACHASALRCHGHVANAHGMPNHSSKQQQANRGWSLCTCLCAPLDDKVGVCAGVGRHQHPVQRNFCALMRIAHTHTMHTHIPHILRCKRC